MCSTDDQCLQLGRASTLGMTQCTLAVRRLCVTLTLLFVFSDWERKEKHRFLYITARLCSSVQVSSRPAFFFPSFFHRHFEHRSFISAERVLPICSGVGLASLSQ